ncbi:glycogen/starch/alpha-glucan phosphorylase [Marinimicrococcus flavescens]|uniref:Alpha-1,4 glucan phosphorylase n=1 Tax=Marinimicrococcus flavescens TaxID=3031815 RepID=A0AAP3XQ11_9PROT|nr:glycogen/starch/alpha-glucan phosphorylase [Marinimicrococcus flavescens]
MIDTAHLSPAPRPLDRDGLRDSVRDKLVYQVGKDLRHATRHDWFLALALAVRERLVDGWMPSTRRVYEEDGKRVYYLSLEFLIGRLLGDALTNLGLHETAREALAELGVDLDRVLKVEPDAALGNGGLGRLAACFMDSMATLEIAGMGYGIRYQHGLFKQGFDEGWQVERPEDWLAFGNPWEFERPDAVYPVRFFGRLREERDPSGRRIHIWEGGQRVLAVAYDTPVVGWQGRHVNTLRLWAAQSGNLVNLEAFNRGEYMHAVEDQVLAESISRVLYPADATEAGQMLRLKQEYFFTSASLQDIIRRHLGYHASLDNLPEKVAIQLNDTHPAIAVPELMRLLIDEHGHDWQRAWTIVRGVFNYTNHTLMPEALERWPVGLIEQLLPRHMQLIYEINAHHLAELRSRPDNHDPFLTEVSLIDEAYGRWVRMGHLAFLGSRRVNGVSALHGELMKHTVFARLHHYFPEKITAITNGVTPRRWLMTANPALSSLIGRTIGDGWTRDLGQLEALAPHAGDAAFRAAFAAAKRHNKEVLAALVGKHVDVRLDPDALFDVQIKRIHEYKRQLLNILEAVALWDEMRQGGAAGAVPRVRLFAGKAASSYWRAKLIIKLINDVARVVNADPATRDRLTILFMPNYNVSLAEKIIPAADLSEQISTAGMEASGTGNMKFAMNGALTIGTLDGANVEMRDAVGPENIFIFGLSAEEVLRCRRIGFAPEEAIARSPRLARALELVESGLFSPDDPGRFRPITDDLRGLDHFLVTADFDAYWNAQRRADALFADPEAWRRQAILNVAGMGPFSSDRAIRTYAQEIWQVPLEAAPAASAFAA